MLCAGDEYGRTQNGNNNAYCQDNELTWLRWKRNNEENQLVEFTRRLIHFRHQHPVFRRPKYLHGKRVRGTDFKEVMWFGPSGNEMNGEEWHGHSARVLGALFSGKTATIRDERGNPVTDDTFLLLFNAHHENVPFTLPGRNGMRWQLLIDTALEEGFLPKPKERKAQEPLELLQRSFCLLKWIEPKKTASK